MIKNVAIYQVSGLERLIYTALPILIFISFVILVALPIINGRKRALQSHARRRIVQARVLSKDMGAESPLVHFFLSDTETLHLPVPAKAFEAISEEASGLLTLQDGRFLSFQADDPESPSKEVSS